MIFGTLAFAILGLMLCGGVMAGDGERVFKVYCNSTQFSFIAQVLITHFRNCYEVCSGLRSTSTHLLIYREWHLAL